MNNEMRYARSLHAPSHIHNSVTNRLRICSLFVALKLNADKTQFLWCGSAQQRKNISVKELVLMTTCRMSSIRVRRLCTL